VADDISPELARKEAMELWDTWTRQLDPAVVHELVEHVLAQSYTEGYIHHDAEPSTSISQLQREQAKVQTQQ
jgi:hypothetical protein